MTGNPLLQLLDQVVEVICNVGLVAAYAVDVFPAAQSRRLENPVDVLERLVDLTLPVVGVEIALPSTLAGTLHSVAKDDAL